MKIDSIHVSDFDGKTINLMEQYKGQSLLLIIYNNRCLGCTGRAIPLAYDFDCEYPSIQVVGIHSDFGNEEASAQDIKSIFTAKEVPFPIYIDRDHKVYDQFDAEGTPQWIAIDKNGTLVRSIYGSQEGSKIKLGYTIDELLETEKQ